MKCTSLPLQRREFITLLGGAAAAWPLVARAQQAERMPAHRLFWQWYARSIDGWRHALRISCRACEKLGYVEGRNVAIDYRWAGDATIDCQSMRRIGSLGQDRDHRAREATSHIAAKQATTTIPIVFADRRRSGRRRACRQLGATGRQHHRCGSHKMCGTGQQSGWSLLHGAVPRLRDVGSPVQSGQIATGHAQCAASCKRAAHRSRDRCCRSDAGDSRARSTCAFAALVRERLMRCLSCGRRADHYRSRADRWSWQLRHAAASYFSHSVNSSRLAA